MDVLYVKEKLFLYKLNFFLEKAEICHFYIAWKIIFIIISSFLLLPSLILEANAQNIREELNSQYVYKIWNNKNNGLPHNGIYDLIEDDEGFIWFTTEEGLVKFDGNTFNIFNEENTADLHSSWFLELEKSSAGGIWALCRNAIVLAERHSIKIIDFRDYLNNSLLNAIAEDQNGVLWAGTSTGELYYVKNNSVEKFPLWDLEGTISILSLKTVPDGLLLGTDKGLFRLNVKSRKVKAIDGFNSLNIRTIAVDHDGSFWVGTHKSGLFHKTANEVINYTEKDGLKDMFIMGLSVAPNGDIWIGTSSAGVQVFSKGRFTSLEEKGFASDGIRNILFTGEDLIWLGTQASGLVKIMPADIKMLPTSTGLSNDIILPIYEHENDDIWVGTAGKGVTRLRNKSVTSFTRKNGLAHDVVLSVYGTKEAVYIGTGNGLNRFNLRSNKIDRHYIIDDGLASNIVQAVYQDRKQRLWVTTRSGGIHIIDQNEEITQLALPSEFSNASFATIFEDSKHNLWFGSMGSGIIRIDPNENITSFTDLPSNIVLSFFEDREGTIWVGTMSGLFCNIDSEIQVYSRSNGLHNNSVYRMIDDGAGYLWLSGNFGLQRIRLSDLEKAKKNYTQNIKIKSRLFDASDGMANSEANGGVFPAGWKMSNGDIWFPTIEGIAIVQPELINEKIAKPNIYIKSLQYGGEEYGHLKEIAIPPGVFNFQIDYSSIDFISPNTINYYYRLAGFNDEWENAKNRRTAYFTALPPGEYTFEIKAEQFGNWSEIETLSFTIKPFFYQSLWFKVLMAVLLICFIFFVIKYYLKNQQKYKLQALIDERTKELKESNDRFEHVTQATNEAIWDYDIISGKLFWGEGITTFFGHNREEFGNISMWNDHLHPDDHQRVLQGLENILNSSTDRWADEYHFLKANGEYAFVLDKGIVIRDSKGKAIRMIGAMQDVTCQKEDEQHRKLLESVVTQANEGVLITDASPGHPIIFVNEAMTKITGYSKEELIGNSTSILYGPETNQKDVKYAISAQAEGKPLKIELLEYTKSGEKIWINKSIAPVKNERGQITHWISTERDVTERKNHIKAIEEQNFKLKAIGWTQSHLVRAPLAKMIGYIDLIESYDPSKLDINQLLNHIKHSGLELDSVIRDIVSRTEIVKKDLMNK